ncbi:MAG: transcription-repair coupling factor [Bacillota bacterium]|nr:transcription-repair coupling factor [Bacillota bacterium]
MANEAVLLPIIESSRFAALSETVRGGHTPSSVFGLPENTKVPILLALQKETGRPILFIAQNDLEASCLADGFEAVLETGAVFLPSREVMLRKVAAHSLDAPAKRIAAIGHTLSKSMKIITASQQAVRALLPPGEAFLMSIIRIEKGKTLDLDALSAKLVRLGYERISALEGKGQFSIRGGILDIFPVQSDMAYRMELFGDEVESIRELDVLSQRSGTGVAEALVYPATEAPVPEWLADSAISRLLAAAKSANGPARDYLEECAGVLREGGSIEGAESFIPLLYENDACFMDYIPKDCIVCLDEPARMRETAAAEDEAFARHAADMLERAEIVPGMSRQYRSIDDVFIQAKKSRTLLLFSTLPRPYEAFHPVSSVRFDARVPAPCRSGAELAREMHFYKDRKWRVVLAARTEPKAGRIHAMLLENGCEAAPGAQTARAPFEGEVFVTTGAFMQGAEYPDIKLLLLTEKELFGARWYKKTAKLRGGIRLDTLADLRNGDYIVHEHHGIGVFKGLETLKIEGKQKDFLVLQYAHEDKLYVPTDQIKRVQKYIGSDEGQPRLSRLGGAEWERTKRRVACSVREIATDLITLYAGRQAEKGYTYLPDTVWQQQFEETFPYEETPDQIVCIAEIKADMENGKIMDRLLCGDVGYGKTEVAARAAFKAVMDSKQAALLVPTTILAQQHFNTFTERFSSFPVRIDMLSRFKTQREQSRTLKALKEGNIDIIIGTHMLLGSGVQFSDLGLLIIDEEQRFGVEHKEKIKTLKKTVDVLTLTATPIPRTLEMSLVGIRDMSVIETPPEDRYPVQTYVMEYSDTLVREAILKEMARKGQAYFVYNRVVYMDKFLQHLQGLVPEARIAMAHGQMPEQELENIMLDFYRGAYDVLLCSTIIESGLDIPNVNTLIVYDADTLGLSQLYQLRGRVGRSNRVAYAFFTFRRDKVLTEPAEKRLDTIREFTEFGAGFKIAMRDLQIRGAGNLLGAQQHGHMQAVGYDMYCKLMREAVAEIKGGKAEETKEASFGLNIEAYIPRSYIEDETQRIEIYKAIAAIENEKDLEETGEELVDRFGKIPFAVQNLMHIALIRREASRAGIASISPSGSDIVLTYQLDAQPDVKRLLALLKANKDAMKLSATQPPSIKVKAESGENALQNLLWQIKGLSVCMSSREHV